MGDGSRRGWRRTTTRVAGGLGLVCLLASPVPASAAAVAGPPGPVPQAEPLQVRVWLGRGEEAVLERGDRARLYYRASEDAYVAVFHVNTDGIVRLLHPRVPDEDHYVRGGRDYRLLFPRSPYWLVDDDPGVGYFFAVASPRPFDLSAFRYSHQAGGWDLSSVGRRVYQDPYAAMDDYVAELIPGWRTEVYALDFVEYHVGRRHPYPRFLCYDCHGFRPYQSWNPYHYTCRSFRLVIYTDPYFYPAYRYRGTRVVYTRPPAPDRVRFAFKERAQGEPWSPVYRRRADADVPGVRGTERRRGPDGPARAAVEPGGAAPERTDGRAAPRRREPGGVESTDPSREPEGPDRARGAGGVPGVGDAAGPRRRDGSGGDPPRPVLRRRSVDDGAAGPPSPVEGNPSTSVEVRPPRGADAPRERPSDVLDRGRGGSDASRGGAPDVRRDGPSRRIPSQPSVREREPRRPPPSTRRPDTDSPPSTSPSSRGGGRGSSPPPPSARPRGSSSPPPSARPRGSSGSPAPSVRSRGRGSGSSPSARPSGGSRGSRGSGSPPPSVRRRPPPSGGGPAARGGRGGVSRSSPPSAGSRRPGRPSPPSAGRRGPGRGGGGSGGLAPRRPPPGS